MNDLQIFNSDIIPVYITDEGKKVVIGRELHERLHIAERYSKWFDRMAGYGFENGLDYTPYQKVHPQNQQEIEDHILTLDMAKHISMIQRTPEGKAIRDKLIELDTNIENLSPELRLLIKLEVSQKQQQQALQDTNNRLDHIGDIIALDTRSWRDDARKLIVHIAQKQGGNEYLRDVQAEIYKLVDQRGGVSLETRLTNKRRRMADEGVCKSKRDRLNKVDVIADDKKLIEIYVAIVKEMAIKYGVDLKSA
nr:MAG TPA: AntA/AntB antirepressor [Caudoviricetes sp.]